MQSSSAAVQEIKKMTDFSLLKVRTVGTHFLAVPSCTAALGETVIEKNSIKKFFFIIFKSAVIWHFVCGGFFVIIMSKLN